MKIIYYLLIALILYPSLGTLLFALVEKINIAKKGKVLIMTFGHPLLTALIFWVCCSPFNSGIATTGVFLIAGSCIGIPFSKIRYFYKLDKNGDEISIDYITPLLKYKTIEIQLAQIKNVSLSTGKRLFDKPTKFSFTVGGETMQFHILQQPTEDLKALTNSLHLLN